MKFDSVSVTNHQENLWQGKMDMLELAKMWLRRCSDSHSTCRNFKEYNRPARLLSIDKSMARVVSTNDFSAMPHYATLSYCWGREPFTTLTMDTMETFCRGFAICDLPKVFRDAIHVARELGLSYIWIDALCIIQQGDDGQDWATESALMKDTTAEGPGLLQSTRPRLEGEAWSWWHIVVWYSRANLTYPQDRLPALAGIARLQHEATGHQYLAGMWRERLVQQLPWYIYLERRKRPAWRAPSWSWMSVDSSAGYSQFYNEFSPPEIFKQYVQVLDVWTTPSGPDLFGQISDGLLSLACSALVGAQLLESGEREGIAEEQEHFSIVRLDGRNIELPVVLDALKDDRTQDYQHVYLLPVLSGRSRPWFRNKDREDKGEDKGEEEGEEKEEEKENQEKVAGIQDRLTVDGLVLRACGDAGDRRHFYRLGSFSFESYPAVYGVKPKERGKDNYHQFIHMFEEEERKASKSQDFDTGSNDISPETCIRITIK
ncbi:heterokaryon incompatibility protein [Colletotrichum musicola]|uniref:Heterokaryon incompatibility protein n=1 Tax=Colletotrichum musicola TaxID=2175873 RepID=A0A8H6JTE2_9PEZI|nr:heterokaryon incompatibility protein [Colletotrichum musicola]